MRWNLTDLEYLLIHRRKIHRLQTMTEQIPEEVKEDRQAELMELQQEIAFDLAEDMVGREVLGYDRRKSCR